tara:strand:- start:818 stop:1243 length:426 start_codon:yes stop_codon:yes gene_type:complete
MDNLIAPETRPWGTYQVIADTEHFKVKTITVKPGQRLSYQYHHHRQEHWSVIEGELTIILDGVEYTKRPGESINIAQGAYHRAWNKSKKLVTFVELQTGTYFGEDDIVRIDDDYGRGEMSKQGLMDKESLDESLYRNGRPR